MFKNIVVPIDLDNAERGKAMLGKVKALAGKDAMITVVNVVEDVPGLITAELPDGMVEKAAHDAKSSLMDMVKTAGLKANVEIRGGRAHHAVVDLAEEIDADLILIASHDPGIKDYFIGSTASGVVGRARCSVLVDR